MRINYLEQKAHENAFSKLGTFYWKLFLIEEVTYNAKHKDKYRRKY